MKLSPRERAVRRALLGRVGTLFSNLVDDSDEQVEQRSVPIGIECTLSVPFCGFNVDAIPKYHNLRRYFFGALLIMSKSRLRIFYCYAAYRDLDWNKHELPESLPWQSIEVPLKDRHKVKGAIDSVMIGFSEHVLKDIGLLALSTSYFNNPTFYRLKNL